MILGGVEFHMEHKFATNREITIATNQSPYCKKTNKWHKIIQSQVSHVLPIPLVLSSTKVRNAMFNKSLTFFWHYYSIIPIHYTTRSHVSHVLSIHGDRQCTNRRRLSTQIHTFFFTTWEYDQPYHSITCFTLPIYPSWFSIEQSALHFDQNISPSSYRPSDYSKTKKYSLRSHNQPLSPSSSMDSDCCCWKWDYRSRDDRRYPSPEGKENHCTSGFQHIHNILWNEN